MEDPEACRVQKWAIGFEQGPSDPAILHRVYSSPIIKNIAGDRMPKMGEVHPDLMGAAGSNLYFEEGKLTMTIGNAIEG